MICQSREKDAAAFPRECKRKPSVIYFQAMRMWASKERKKEKKEKHTELCLGHRTCILPHADLFSKLLGSGGKNREWRQGSKGFPLLFG